MSWCMHLLSTNPNIQTRLRNEVLSLPANSSSYSDSSRGSSPTPSEANSCSSVSLSSFGSSKIDSDYALADAIDALPFLDGVVRETLRLCPPVHSAIRTAAEDDSIPVSSPITLRDGTEVTSIRIKKGSLLHIPIEGLNMSEDIWGSDAQEFKYASFYSREYIVCSLKYH